MTIRDHKKRALPEAKKATPEKGRSRGATRSQIKKSEKPLKVKKKTSAVRSESPIKWGRYFVATLVVSAACLGLAKMDWGAIYQKAYVATNRPLKHIAIEGEFRYVSKAELQERISEKLDGSFVDLDLRAIKDAIESNPWVSNVKIERVWPDSLKLKVHEHKPIARWNNNGFIASDGKLISTGDNAVLETLPLLQGDLDLSQEVSENYLAFSEILKSSELKIRGIEADLKRSWTIEFEDGFMLVLGNENIHERLENFTYVFNAYLLKKKLKLEKVDMRYEHGLAIKWKEGHEQNGQKENNLVASNAVK